MASELLPEPLGPQQTVSWSRGMSTSTSLRLCCRAPRTLMIAVELRRRRGCLRLRTAWPSRLRRLIGRSVRAVKHCAQRPGPCANRVVCGDFFGRAGGDDPAAAVAAFGPEVDDPVGRLDHVQVVLDDQHRVAGVDEVVQHLRAAARCRRSAGRSSARRAGRASGRCSS